MNFSSLSRTHGDSDLACGAFLTTHTIYDCQQMIHMKYPALLGFLKNIILKFRLKILGGALNLSLLAVLITIAKSRTKTI